MADQKAIFITGGGSGIGQAIAQAVRRRAAGASGWPTSTRAGLAATAAMLPAGMVEHLCDGRARPRRLGRQPRRVRRDRPAGGSTCCSTMPGSASGGPLAEMSFDEIDRVVAINLVGVLNGARIGYAYLARTPGSCLLNTAVGVGDLRLGRARGLFGDQVRRARADRGARRRMGTATGSRCAIDHAELHRHAVAQRPVGGSQPARSARR